MHASMVGSYGVSPISVTGEEGLTETPLPLEMTQETSQTEDAQLVTVTDESIQRPLTPPSPEAAPLSPAATAMPQLAGHLSARKRRADRNEGQDSWRDTAETFLKSRMAEKPNPDHEVLKGLLPHIGELNRAKKRAFFREVSQLLFQKLDEQDQEEALARLQSSNSDESSSIFLSYV